MNKGKRLFCTIFLAPATIIYSIFFIFPVISSVYYSLTNWDGISSKTFVWLKNYKFLYQDGDYWTSMKNTSILIIYTFIFQVFVGLILAYLLFRIKRGFKFFRAVYFIPVVISPIAIGLLFSMFYNGQFGPLNKFLVMLGLGRFAHDWLSDPSTVLKAVIAPQVWQYIGLYIIIFLAALQSVPEEVLESADIDGASEFIKFFKIIIPLLWEVIIICIILAFTGSIKSFEYPWVITGGGPGSASSYIALMMFKTAFIGQDFGYASAITVNIILYSLIFTVILKKYASKGNIEY